MITLSLQIFDDWGGNLVGDVTARAVDVVADTDAGGYLTLSFSVPMLFDEAMLYYERPGLFVVKLKAGPETIWEGRVEDIGYDGLQLHVLAFGAWRALSDVPYNAFWSSTDMSQFVVVDDNEIADALPGRFEFDVEGHLYIAPKHLDGFKDDVVAYLSWSGMDKSRNDLVTVSFDYELAAASPWKGKLYSTDLDAGSLTEEWSLTGSGSLATGSQSITLAANAERILFGLVYDNAGLAEYTGETGDTYLRITNLRIKGTSASTVTPRAIIADVIAHVDEVNPGQLSANLALVDDIALDLLDYQSEDRYGVQVLQELAELGDDGSPPQRMEVGVWDGRRVHYRVRGSQARTFYVDAAEMFVNRSIDKLHNGNYSRYKDQYRRVRRTSTLIDDASAARYGITRISEQSLNTTQAAEAEAYRDQVVEYGRHITPDSEVKIPALYTANGSAVAKHNLRAGDTIVIRNIPPTASQDVDMIRRMRVDRTSYQVDTDELSVVLEFPRPRLEDLVREALLQVDEALNRTEELAV